jgi:hypothetical protein
VSIALPPILRVATNALLGGKAVADADVVESLVHLGQGEDRRVPRQK